MLTNNSLRREILRVEVKGIFNSFREPKAHKSQSTFLVPPRTTILGLAGAALGVDKDDLKELKDLKVSTILLEIEGKARDLWRYTMVKKAGREGYSVGPSILFRDMLYGAHYYIYYYHPDKEVIKKLKFAFEHPFYALTLGMADELINIKSAEIIPVEQSTSDLGLTNTMIPFDIQKQWKIKLPKMEPGIYRPPVIERLPADSSARFSGEDPKIYSVIVSLVAYSEEPLECWADGERRFFLF